MDDLGFNKIAAAVLATGLGFMGLKEISHMVMHVEIPETPAYALALPEVVTDGAAEIEIPFPSPAWIAAMDATRGETVFKKCVSCHNAENGGKNGTGPNLWNIVGQPIAQRAGFGYSSAAKSSGIVWDYESLDGFLTKPKKYLKGTNMAYNGIKKEADRAAVIEYLRVQSSAPLDRPEAAVLEVEPDVMDVETVEIDAETVTDVITDTLEDTPAVPAPTEQ